MIFTVPDPHNSHNPPIAEGTLEQVARLLEPGQYKAVADDGDPVTINIAARTNVTAWATGPIYLGPMVQYSITRSAW